jgi:hypothetical protein
MMGVLLPKSIMASEQSYLTRQLWSTTTKGADVVGVANVDDVNGDGYEDVIVCSKLGDASGYLTLINGKTGLVMREIDLNYAPTEMLYASASKRLAVARSSGGVDVYDTQLNLKFTIPPFRTHAQLYNRTMYWHGVLAMNQSDYGKRPKELYPVNPYNKTENWGYIEQPTWWDIPQNTTTVVPMCLTTFNGTDITYLDGYYGTTHRTCIVSYSLVDGSLNWWSGGIYGPVWGLGPYGGPPDHWVFYTWIAVQYLMVISPARAIAIAKSIGVAGYNWTNPSGYGEWPMLLLDNNGGRVHQRTLAAQGLSPWFFPGVEAADWNDVVSPPTQYDGNHFLVTVTNETSSELVLYSVENGTINKAWGVIVDRFDLNKGFAIPDISGDDKNEVLVVLNGTVTILSGADGTVLSATDIATARIIDVKPISSGYVILTQEGDAYLLAFKQATPTLYWKLPLGMSPLITSIKDVDGDDFEDIVAATANNVTCYWGSWTIPPPPPPIYHDFWFWATTMVVADAVVIGAFVFTKRRAFKKKVASQKTAGT